MQVAIVIPARLASTRLPEKLLLNETGRPLIQHTYESAVKGRAANSVIVAVDDPRLLECVDAFGGRAIMTDPNARSGTDRVAEVAKALPEFDFFVNVQGDEPQIESTAIDIVIDLITSDLQADIATLATPIQNRALLDDPACVKVVRRHDGSALYFSRSPIPHPRHWDDSLLTTKTFLQHIGLYAFRREFLLNLESHPASCLETTESLEQLRFLESGSRIQVGIVDSAAKGIDTRADYDAFVQSQL
jgi:3-deoxy-manno-octulosonate cytidylyltransferase (CMP-KDO synthetase)